MMEPRGSGGTVCLWALGRGTCPRDASGTPNSSLFRSGGGAATGKKTDRLSEGDVIPLERIRLLVAFVLGKPAPEAEHGRTWAEFPGSEGQRMCDFGIRRYWPRPALYWN